MDKYKKKAQEHFKSTGEWFPGCIMHHKDTTLKYNDIDRYNEWRIEDLCIMSLSEHTKLHKPTLGKHWNLKEDTKNKMRKPKTVEHRLNISKAAKGKKHNWKTKGSTGMNWFTNGANNVLCFECPDGYFKGRTTIKK